MSDRITAEDRTFTDVEGDDWTLRMGYYEVEEIEEQTGITLIAHEEAEEDDPMQKLFDKPSLLVEVLYICLKGKAEERDLDPDEAKKRFSYGPFSDQVEAWTNAFYEFLGMDQEEIEEARPTAAEKGSD